MKKWIKEYLREKIRLYLKYRHPSQLLPPTTWGLAYADSQLNLHGVALNTLLDEYGSPLHVADAARLQANLNGFQLGGKCLVYYSYKTNPVPGLLAYLHQLGAGAEVISEYELWLARSLGVPPSKIIFNGPAKSDAALHWAIENEIHAIHVNHLEELGRISEIAQKLNKIARIGLRVTHSGWQAQFGLSLHNNIALDALASALKTPHVRVVSLHCHRGFAIRDESDLTAHLNPLFHFCEAAYQQHNWLPEILDIGGSLAIPSVYTLSTKEAQRAWTFFHPPAAPNLEKTLSPQRYAQQAHASILNFFNEKRWPLPEIALEPGRALTGNAQMLLTRAIEIRKDHPASNIVLDAGISVARSARDDFHQLFPLQEQHTQPSLYRLVGPICHPGDVLYPAWQLPPVEIGNGFAIMDSGAYFTSDASSFSFPQPGVAIVQPDGSHRLWRRTQGFEDMKSLDT